MKTIKIKKEYLDVFLDFVDNEVIDANQNLEGIILYSDFLFEKENFYLFECFKSLNKNFDIEEIEKKLNVFFPHGLLISANQHSYEAVKKYCFYLASLYEINPEQLFFNPNNFLNIVSPNIFNDIESLFLKYKDRQKFYTQLKEKIKSGDNIYIDINENKFLCSKIILNPTARNIFLLENFLENEIFTANSKIIYIEEDVFLLEYFLLRSLSCSQNIIKKMILEAGKNNIIEIKNNIIKKDVSYFINFKEEQINFKENMILLDKKILFLKLKEDNEEKSSGSNSSSKGVVKI